MTRATAGKRSRWNLRLYEKLCQAHLAGRYSIQVVDLLENPTLTERVLIGLDLRPNR